VKVIYRKHPVLYVLCIRTGVDLSKILGKPKHWGAKGGNNWWKHI